MKTKYLKAFLAVFALYLLFPSKSYAYLDLGSGSYILQMLLAGFFAALLFLKTFWKNLVLYIKALFSKNKKNDKPVRK